MKRATPGLRTSAKSPFPWLDEKLFLQSFATLYTFVQKEVGLNSHLLYSSPL
jgi:hypothetical protein